MKTRIPLNRFTVEAPILTVQAKQIADGKNYL
jgi:hypothetical protein